MNKRIIIIIGSILILCTVLGIAIINTDQLYSFDSSINDQVKLGENIYRDHCASCHGKNLEGQPNWKQRNAQGRLPAPPHDETGHTWHHDDQLLFDLTKHGMVPPNIPEGYQSDMPAYEDILSDDEIWAVLQYIKSRWPQDIQNMQNERNTAGSSFKKQ